LQSEVLLISLIASIYRLQILIKRSGGLQIRHNGVSSYGDRKLELSKALWRDVDDVSLLIEPVLISEDHPSPLYDDVMRTGIAV